MNNRQLDPITDAQEITRAIKQGMTVHLIGKKVVLHGPGKKKKKRKKKK